MSFHQIGVGNLFLVLILMVFTDTPWYLFMLVIAQFIFVPLVLHIVCDKTWLVYLSLPVYGLLFFSLLETAWEVPTVIGAMIYFLFTICIALVGITRFLHRGCTHFEEFLIDMGFISLAIGGAWYVAYKSNIDTGFSPMINWLTSIHFHYSSFFLLIFVGLLGRLHQPKGYHFFASIILLSPFLVAVGISYSYTIEILSVLLYIVGIYRFIYFSFQTNFQSKWQQWLVRISFSALGISILFSLLYAFGNFTGIFTITIDVMLRFHGITNMIAFALCGVIGWLIHTPPSNWKQSLFPISNIRGQFAIGQKVLNGKTTDQLYRGLVDDMKIYSLPTLKESIKDFYENTSNYELYANVTWHKWFFPFAVIYRLASRGVKQLNLPLSNKKIKMTGEIVAIKEELDGRIRPRGWIRKANGEYIFIALYSYHISKGKAYMNIALPLPFSTMIGILELTETGDMLQLTSKRKQNDRDSGIYIVIGKKRMKLPLEEHFEIWEEDGTLKAVHHMWIFSMPFLRIDYDIIKKPN